MNKYALLIAASLLGACKGEDPQAAAAAQAAAKEQAAAPVLQQYESAVAAQNWELAKAQADLLQWQHKGTQAAAKVEENYAEIKAKADAIKEDRRLVGLWSYDNVAVGKKGTQKTASIYSKERVDVDGSGAKPVRLIFRDHPEWGKSAYLVLQAGDFRCPGGCKVQVKADEAAAKAMAATRPDTDEAIAMFIEDERALWRIARKAKSVSIEFPVKAGGTRTALFETGGLDGARLAGWD
ncbi:MAG TPA: hypothetical protein VJ806_08490 [Luteimonas sp.]|nr:hypothetical protein [Luteimonas sp.]